MSTDPQACPKCGGEMVQGFLPDATYGQFSLGFWAPGTPEKNYYWGTLMLPKGRIPIGVFRCEQCGYLEQYARPEFAPKYEKNPKSAGSKS